MTGDERSMNIQKVYSSVLSGESEGVENAVRESIRAGIKPATILNDGLIKAMAEVGARFERGEFFVPEMLIAARAMQSGLAIIRPQLMDQGIKAVGRVVIGTVKGDLHDIGKNLVSMMLEGAGLEIVDLGTDVSPETFVDAIKGQDVQLVCLSALLTTTMQNMKSTLVAIDELGSRDKVKIMIGGAPVTQAYANEIGADGYASNAGRAVEKAKELLQVQ